MEGLIPFIYKAIKERRTRSYSRCSSTGSALGGRFGARVEDGGAWDSKRWEEVPAVGSEMAHRRHRSLEELAGEVGASPAWRQPGALPRGRSMRIFSCIGGM
ncbi:uncharacterized protein LOC120708926 [Panicum virgatum]|uniref:Uncharacterized protein n=1 Tax=Panicum virgatum TaxID=38727 RepID=A0A8T0SV04_PANVG|nr:uncharacterized protein LOC120708926 [Panicum virgatum]KAG2602461.1 hypothetical protein PVAP13_5KG682000 [Panicum virgatum]